MAAFDPATIALLREQLRETEAQHRRALDRRRKLDLRSKSKMAQRLDAFITDAVAIMRDLEWLLEFMQRLTDQADRHAVERAAAEQDIRGLEWFELDPAELPPGHADGGSTLSHTPLAIAFGAEPVAEDGEPA